MKRLLRSFVIETGILYFISLIFSGLVFSGGFLSLLATGAALVLGTYIVRPVINMLLLPLNLITFGLFKWVSHAIILYLVDLVLEDFSVQGFAFAGVSSPFFSLPAMAFTQPVLAYIAFSFVLSILTSLIYWLVK